jgi:ATP-dependent Clp protease ATP-binding subunit ClpC
MPNRMERFTQRSRRVLSLTEEASAQFQHPYLGTEHLLLGLMREEGSISARVLWDMGVEQSRVVELINRLSPAGKVALTARIDLTYDMKRVLEFAIDEARLLGHPYIGTEHLLLGLVRQPTGTVSDIFKELSISADEIRQQVRRIIQLPPTEIPGISIMVNQIMDALENFEDLQGSVVDEDIIKFNNAVQNIMQACNTLLQVRPKKRK